MNHWGKALGFAVAARVRASGASIHQRLRHRGDVPSGQPLPATYNGTFSYNR